MLLSSGYPIVRGLPKLSAGLLMYRKRDGALEVFLVHPGGPFWRKKDAGAWSIPKGEYLEGEDPLSAAIREFEEETSIKPDSDFVALREIRQPSGKIVTAWALEGDCDPASVKSNLFSMEWPKGSGVICEFPEVDRGEWFPIDIARDKIHKGQVGFLDRLLEMTLT
jgi:predicted NUDIX family NTP pyrophosphohydrolase